MQIFSSLQGLQNKCEFTFGEREAMDSILAMISMEGTYLADNKCSFDNEDMYHTIISWKYKVVDAFNLDRSIVDISINYLNRYLSKKRTLDESTRSSAIVRKFRILSLTCLYVAIKIHCRGTLSANIFAKIGIDFSTQDILECERAILEVLRFKMNPPTPSAYLHLIFQYLCIQDEYIETVAYYLIQKAMFDYNSIWCNYSSFSLAFAALKQAILSCQKLFVGTSYADLEQKLEKFYYMVGCDFQVNIEEINVVINTLTHKCERIEIGAT